MKVVFCERYGPPEVLKIKEIEKPVPKANDILVKVIATAVNSGDVRVRGLVVDGFMRIVMRLVLGFKGPRNPILGTVFSGVVENVGDSVKMFKPGDKVYATTGMKMGTYAEYIALSENKTITLKPTKASFEEAAALPFGGTTSLYFLHKAGISKKPKQKSEAGVQLMKSLHVDHTIVYTKEDFTKNGKRYDIIFDTVGKMPKKACQNSLVPDGKYITTAALDVASEKKEQLQLLSELFDKGEYKAVIDRTYPLEEIVEAHTYVDQGKKKGNVIIKVSKA